MNEAHPAPRPTTDAPAESRQPYVPPQVQSVKLTQEAAESLT